MRHGVVVLLLLLPGCYESITIAERRDGGGPTTVDSSVDPTPPPSTPDTGIVPPEGPCERGEIVPPYEGPGCAAETVACLETCSTDPTAPPDCSGACLGADPECVECFNHTIVSCSNSLSCQAQWNVFACCAENRCPTTGEGIDRLACAMEGECLIELDAYATCADDVGSAACNMEIQRCLEP